jgi:hypothetical protein
LLLTTPDMLILKSLLRQESRWVIAGAAFGLMVAAFSG